MNAKTLSIVIPFRIHPKLPHLLERLEDLLQLLASVKHIEIIVVDSSSAPKHLLIHESICRNYQAIHLVMLENEAEYSLARARNAGATLATGRWLCFHDIDLRTSADFWPRLLDFCKNFGLGRFKKRYLAIPCIYLTKESTTQYLNQKCRQEVHMSTLIEWVWGNNDNIQTFAPCSSFIIINRLQYLSVGGHDTSFTGHGFEDFELHHRLSREFNILPDPKDYYFDSQSWITKHYRGFRAKFSLIGRSALFANLVAIHLWHERPKEIPFYQTKKANSSKLIYAMKSFDKYGIHPTPLPSFETGGHNFLFLGQKDSTSFKTLRDIFPLLGRVIARSEYLFFDENNQSLNEQALNQLLIDLNVSLILFPNPYRNPARFSILEWCRNKAFPFLVFERGALPDSWHFDDSGFNVDSKRYARKLWDLPLSLEEITKVETYIQWCLSGIKTVETQGARIGAEKLREKLQISANTRVLFIPLQRPSDTVIVHFAGASKCFDQFVDFIDALASRLEKEDWIVLCKCHPYENSCKPLSTAKYVDADTHIIDLIELSNTVALMNSGVGIYAMMMNKPCLIMADAFYSIEGVNRKIKALNITEICNILSEPFSVNMKTVYKFIHYLRYKFYSFGQATYDSCSEPDGSIRKFATSIDFYEIRIQDKTEIVYSVDSLKKLTLDAPLFENFNFNSTSGT
jgi:predicted glycosyltransferase involved in capsule biosynthesis